MTFDMDDRLKTLIDKLRDKHKKWKDEGNDLSKPLDELKKAMNIEGKSIGEATDKDNFTADTTKMESYLKQYEPLITVATTLPKKEDVTILQNTGISWFLSLMESNQYEEPMEMVYLFKLALKEESKKKPLGERIMNAGRRFKKSFKLALNAMELLPLMTKNIMGQYDSMLMGKNNLDHKVLKFVQPNIERIAGEVGVAVEDMMKEVIIHEAIHSRQFSNFDYLEKDLGEGLVAKIISDYVIGYGGIPGLPVEDAKNVGADVETKIAAYMSIAEGHAVFYTDEVLCQALPDFAGFKERKKAYAEKKKAERKDLPEMYKKKRAQYTDGQKFIKEVYAKVGVPTSKLVLGNIPTPSEMKEPKAYLKRMGL